MTIEALEPGTYRANDGTLIHCRQGADGSLRFDHDDGTRAAIGELAVKLSDDPDWPDAPRATDVLLLID